MAYPELDLEEELKRKRIEAALSFGTDYPSGKSEPDQPPKDIRRVYGDWSKWPSLSPEEAADIPTIEQSSLSSDIGGQVPAGHIDLKPPSFPVIGDIKTDPETATRYRTDRSVPSGMVPRAELATVEDIAANPPDAALLPKVDVEGKAPIQPAPDTLSQVERATLVKLPAKPAPDQLTQVEKALPVRGPAPDTLTQVERALPSGPKAPGTHTELAPPGQMDLRTDEVPAQKPVAREPAAKPALDDWRTWMTADGTPADPSFIQPEAKAPTPVDTLKVGEGNRVDPGQLFSYLQSKFADSGLVGYVPPDGARWGINTGSAAEWAAFGLAVAKQESDLNTRSYNASDPGGSVGLFQFGQGQTQFTKGGNQFDPQESADAFVRSVQHYVANEGRVANLGATFGSIRRPNEAGQYIGYAQEVAARDSGGTLSAPKKEDWESWATLSPAEQSVAEAAGQSRAKGEIEAQQNILSAVHQNAANMPAFYHALENSIPGVSDTVRNATREDFKQEITKYAQDYYQEPDPDKAFARIMEAPNLLTSAGEIITKAPAHIQHALLAMSRSLDANGENRIIDFVNKVHPEATPEARAAFVREILSKPAGNERTQFVSALYSGVDPQITQGISLPTLLDSIDTISKPGYQEKRTAEIKAAVAKNLKDLRTDPTMENTWGGTVSDAVAQMPKNLGEALFPVIGQSAMTSEIYFDTLDGLRKEHPDWSEEELKAKAGAATVPQVALQEIVNLATMGLGGGFTKSITNPVARIAANSILHGTVASGAGTAQQGVANVATGRPITEGLPQAALAGGIQGMIGGAMHVPEARARVEKAAVEPPSPEATTGPKGAPIRGATNETLVKTGPTPEPATPSSEQATSGEATSGLLMQATDKYGNIIGQSGSRKGRSEQSDVPRETPPEATPPPLPLEAHSDEPIIGYHGTQTEFDRFQESYQGIHFSSDPETARIFATAESGKGRIIKARLDIRNPLRIQGDPGWHSLRTAEWLDDNGYGKPGEKGDLGSIQSRVFEAGKNHPFGSSEQEIAQSRELNQVLKEFGHDGIVYTNKFEGKPVDTYVVYDPSQITSLGEPIRGATDETLAKTAPIETQPSPVIPPEAHLAEPDANTHAPVTATPSSEVPLDAIAQANSQDLAQRARMQSLQELTGFSHLLPEEAQADLRTAFEQAQGVVQPARRARVADTPALPRPELDRAVDSFRRSYAGSAPIEVVNSANELPPQVRAQLHAQGSHENISAFVHSHPETGERIYILADRQHSLANLTGDLMEEAIGHSGVRSVLAPAQMQTLTRAIDNRFSNDRSYLRLLRQGYEKGQAAEEFLAKLAREPDRSPKFLNGAISYIAGGLRKVANRMGLDFQITKPELQHIIARARARVARPRPEAVGVMTTEPSFRASRAAPAPALTTAEKVRRLENATIEKNSGSKEAWKKFLGGFRSLVPEVGREKEAASRGESVPIQHWLRYLKGIDGKVQNDAANQVRHVIDPLLKVPGELHPELVDRLQKIDRRIDELKAAGKTVPQKLLDEQKQLDGFKKSSPFWLFSRKVLYNDLYARSEIQHGVDKNGRPEYLDLPAGMTKNEVIGELRELNHDIAKLSPDQQNAITESLRRHYKMVQDIKGDLTRRGFVIPKEFSNPFYFPHILLDHAKGYLARARHSTEEDFRGYLMDPVGSEKPIETSYVKAMMSHLVEVMSHNARGDATAEMLKPLDKSQVFKDDLKRENRERALKGQAPLPNRVWEDRARQAGYEIYVPDKHIPMRMEAMIDRDKLSKQIGKQINEGDLAENLKKMGVTLTADDLRTALAAGTREKWAVTPEQRDAMRSANNRVEAERAQQHGWGHNIAKITQAPLSLWKGYKLHSPTAAVRYHWGNLTSDVEKIFTADPKVFKHLPEAYRLMSEYNKEGRYPNERFAKAIEHDVISAPTAGEVNYLREKLPQFEDLMSQKEKNWGKIKAFWEASQRFGDIRESTFRLAKYLSDMDRLDKGQTYEKGEIPAAALIRDLKAHKTDEAKAAQNAREMFIDYKAISPAGQFLRKNMIPFYSYQEGNARYFVNMFRNMLDMSVPNKSEFVQRGGRALLTIPSKVLIARSTRGFLLRMGVAQGLLASWNGYVKQRDGIKDTDLSDEDRRKDHILLGKGKDGKVQLMYVPTAENDFLSWLGGPAFGQLASDYLGGKITLQQAAADWAKTFGKDTVSKIVNSIRPEIKTGFGLMTGRDLFPDATNPKRINSYDMPGWMIAQAFDQPTADAFESLRDPNFYRNKSWGDTIKQIVLQIRQRDPEQWGYYDIQNKVQDFLESKGYGPHGESAEKPDSQIVRNFKRALFNGDLDAAQRFAQILVDKYGYNSEKFAASIRAKEPMAEIKKDLRPEFVKTLSESDREQLKKAYTYYARVRGDESKVQTEARAIFGPKAKPQVSRAALQAAILEARDSARRAAAAESLMQRNPAFPRRAKIYEIMASSGSE